MATSDLYTRYMLCFFPKTVFSSVDHALFRSVLRRAGDPASQNQVRAAQWARAAGAPELSVADLLLSKETPGATT